MKIGLTCTPSKRLNNHKFKGKEVLVSWGGGMGGANKTFYCVHVDKEKDDTFYEILDHLGKKHEINKMNIVRMTDVDIVEVENDITEHRNHQSKTCNKCIEKLYYKIEPDTTVEFSNEYDNNAESNAFDKKYEIS